MQTISIMLGDFSDVKDYLAIVEKCPNMIYARDKAGREVNAKGIIGLMSLDRSNPIDIFCKNCDITSLAVSEELGRYKV